MMSLELLVRAIKSRTPISFEHNKAGKTPGLCGNAHAVFIMRRKDGTESTKVDIVQTAGVSDTDPPVFPEWRLFDVTEISNIVLREQEAPFPIDPGYKADSHRYEFAIGSGLSLVSNRLSEDDINTILGRKDALEVFSEMLENSGSYTEPNWQVFFEANEWIFGYGLKYRYLRILQREAHFSSTNLDGSNDVISDFLLSDTRFTKLVELKAPNTSLFENRRNRSDSWRLSTDLTDAVSQILAQKANWELQARNRNYDADGNLVRERASDVECILVIGTHATISGSEHEIEVKLKTLELYRRNLRSIEIVLYDELFDRARFIVAGQAVCDYFVGAD